ncbi:MAG: thymidylate synthase [Patescibacteria group bacterium]|nr:MAG: thymidylate synthase [Patescibacteria group bacterium]
MRKNNHPEYQYLNLLEEVLEKGIKNVDRGTGAISYSVFGRQTRYDLTKGFPLLTTKRVYWKGVVHELYWFMSGQTNIKYLVDNNVHIWDDYPYKIYNLKNKGRSLKLTKEEFIERIKNDEDFAKKWGELPKIYGEMWRAWPTRTPGRTIDQLKWVLQELKDDPDARNLIVTSWNPEYLYTMATYEDASRFPICHNMYQISQKGGKLSLQLYQRSADLFLGVPFNIASYSLLLLILCQITGYKPGEFIHTFGDAHIYENHIEQVKEQLRRKPRSLPTVTIDPSVKSLEDFRPEHVTLENYNPHPVLKGELTVAGGLYEKNI